MLPKITSTLLGLATGDALGVPVEFLSRDVLSADPVTGMRAFGTHRQPAGTWSDDSSLAFCLAEALTVGYDLNHIAANFVKWYDENYWTAHGNVFDVGISTAQVLERLKKGESPLVSGNIDEQSNGNGSLMRILPLVFTLQHDDILTRFKKVSAVSAITHAHIRSVVACFIYTELALELLKGTEKMQAYCNMQQTVNTFIRENKTCSGEELHRFHRILENPYGEYNIRHLLDYQELEINSRGYVLDTLEAAIWCFLKWDNYQDIVLKAVNLGHDTDTTGCVAGGLAGLYYGQEGIPESWLNCLARKADIIDLAKRLNDSIS